jgi:hypothetical protein
VFKRVGCGFTWDTLLLGNNSPQLGLAKTIYGMVIKQYFCVDLVK